MTNPSISSEPSSALKPELTSGTPGYRAAEAYVRPAPIYTNGYISSYVFDLKKCEFTLELDATKLPSEDQPTTVFLPEYHFPVEQCTVVVSGGKWEICSDDEERAVVQKLRWWHSDGPQSLKVIGVVRTHNVGGANVEDAGYLEQCQQYGVSLKDCSVM